MSKFKSQYDMPYDVNPSTEFHWLAFNEYTRKGSALAALNSYVAFCEARRKEFKNQNTFGREF